MVIDSSRATQVALRTRRDPILIASGIVHLVLDRSLAGSLLASACSRRATQNILTMDRDGLGNQREVGRGRLVEQSCVWSIQQVALLARVVCQVYLRSRVVTCH